MILFIFLYFRINFQSIMSLKLIMKNKSSNYKQLADYRVTFTKMAQLKIL